MYELPVFLGPPDGAVRWERLHLVNNTDQAQNAVVTVGGHTSYPATLPAHQGADLLIFKDPGNFGGAIDLSAEPANGKGERTTSSLDEPPQPILKGTRFLVVSASDSWPVLARPKHLSNLGAYPAVEVVNQAIPFQCRASIAPDRPGAYEPFDAIVVDSTASKRLANGAIGALKDYVLCGGHLLFSPGLSDPRWADLGLGRADRVRLGLGSATLLRFDPVESSKAGRTDLGETLKALSVPEPQYRWLDPAIKAEIAPTQDSAPVDYSDQPRQDPFAVRLPPFIQVLAFVLLYFVAVVPLNFFVLSRLRRPELTWITAPAFAIVFAAVLFKGAGALYGVRASNAVKGVLVAQEGLAEGVFKGTSDVFIPNAGAVDLKLRGVDGVWDRSSQGQPVAGSIDTGTIQVPQLQAKNLQFRSFDFIERVPLGDWFRFERLKARDGFVPIKVTNASPYAIRRAQLFVGILAGPYQDLLPGHSMVMMTVDTASRPSQRDKLGKFSIPDVVGAQGRILLTGNMDDLPMGCEIGSRVSDRTDLKLAVFARPELKANPEWQRDHEHS